MERTQKKEAEEEERKDKRYIEVGLLDYGKNYNCDYFWSIIVITIIENDYSLTLEQQPFI